MTPPPNQDLQSELAALAADPALSRFVEPDGALLVIAADGERLLCASPGAGLLREVLADGDGRLLRMHPLSERARALAGGLAPFAGLRLERIRLGSGALAPLVTCGFRQVGLSSGDRVLAIAIPGPIEAIAAPRNAAARPRHGPLPLAGGCRGAVQRGLRRSCGGRRRGRSGSHRPALG